MDDVIKTIGRRGSRRRSGVLWKDVQTLSEFTGKFCDESRDLSTPYDYNTLVLRNDGRRSFSTILCLRGTDVTLTYGSSTCDVFGMLVHTVGVYIFFHTYSDLSLIN